MCKRGCARSRAGDDQNEKPMHESPHDQDEWPLRWAEGIMVRRDNRCQVVTYVGTRRGLAAGERPVLRRRPGRASLAARQAVVERPVGLAQRFRGRRTRKSACNAGRRRDCAKLGGVPGARQHGRWPRMHTRFNGRHRHPAAHADLPSTPYRENVSSDRASLSCVWARAVYELRRCGGTTFSRL